MSGASTCTGGSSVGRRHFDRTIAEAPGERASARADEIVDRLPVASQVHLTGLEAHEVEHVRDELGHLLGLASIDRTSCARTLGLEYDVGVIERAACPRNHGERSAQIMGDRSKQRVAQPFRLYGDTRDLSLLRQLGTFDR